LLNLVELDQDVAHKGFSCVLTIFSEGNFLVDCWATWCSPCFEGFKHKEPLMELLKSQNMAIVYISFDRPEAESAWLNAIREQKLEGFHLRINDQLVDELMGKGFPGYFPIYLVVNPLGDVLIANAHRPSQLNDLAIQIKGIIAE
jgi:thiol-disulfide isomerase/thioredoxin